MKHFYFNCNYQEVIVKNSAWFEPFINKKSFTRVGTKI